MDTIRNDLLCKHYESSKVAACIAHADGQAILSVPDQGYAVLPARFVQLCIQDFLLQGQDALHPQILAMDPVYFIGIAQLDDENFLIYGPASPIKHSAEEIRRFSAGFGLEEHLGKFINTVSRTPLMGYRAFASGFCVAIYLASGRNISIESVYLCNNTPGLKSAEEAMQEDLFLAREEPLSHAAYSFETALMDALKAGDRELLSKRALQPFAGRAGKISTDAVRQERYTFIVTLALATRAAIEGGAPEEEAYTLSDTYALRMDSLTGIRDIMMLTYDMLMDFCTLVARNKDTAHCSQPVRKCLEYISLHLHEDISLSHFAELTGLCTRAISQKFRQETGMSVVVYIQKQKIEEAKYLLRHTDYSYSEISNYLNFCTQSYFTKIFKETVGMTPQQYREQ